MRPSRFRIFAISVSLLLNSVTPAIPDCTEDYRFLKIGSPHHITFFGIKK
jgi:hypothetical protein